jgi:hypothetical protein
MLYHNTSVNPSVWIGAILGVSGRVPSRSACSQARADAPLSWLSRFAPLCFSAEVVLRGLIFQGGTYTCGKLVVRRRGAAGVSSEHIMRRCAWGWGSG